MTIESTGGGQIVAKGLSKADASSARQLLEELISGGNSPVSDGRPSPTPPIDIADQIRKLDELRSQGLLSDAEFEAKKTQLLDRM